MPTAQTPDGAQIHYERRGTGPTSLAMFSGWGGVGGLWFAVARHLDPRQFTCWLIDLRGHGKSVYSGADYGWDAVASDVMSVAEAEAAEDFIPVGFSMGGKVALYLTAKYPARIPRVILVSPAGPGPAPIALEERRQLARKAADWQQLKAAIRNWFGPTVSEATIDSCCRALSRTPGALLEITAEKLLGAPLPAGFDRTNAPALVVMGERDPHYGPGYQDANVLPFLSHAQKAVLPSAHFAPLEHPVELAALISSFARLNSAA